VPLVAIFSCLLPLVSAPVAAQEPGVARPDPATGRIELPAPGPRPGWPQAHLWRPLALESWQFETSVEGRLGLDAGDELRPSDVVLGVSLGTVANLQADASFELRAAQAPDATGDDIAHAAQAGGTYVAYTSGTSMLSAAGSLALWIPIQAAEDLALVPTIFGVVRLARPFGFRVALSLPVTLTSDPQEVLSFVLRPEVQPLAWLWLDVGAGVALAGADDLLVPLDFEIGLTPWTPLDLVASFAFPDLEGSGPDCRSVKVAVRFRP
jgi:hypothetical protein